MFGILLVTGVGSLAGPIGGGLILIGFFIAEQINNSNLTKQREEHIAYENKLLSELSEIKEKEKIKEEYKAAVDNLKNELEKHEVKRNRKVSNTETIYMMRGKRHIFDGVDFIEIDEK